MKQLDLLNGKILSVLTKLTIPIVATSFMSMAYNMVDMFWIGKMGSSAVAAVGVSSMFSWFSAGLVIIPRVGGQVKLGHSLGEHNEEKAIKYASSALQIAIVIAIVYGIISIFGAPILISFFNLNAAETVNNAVSYLQIICGFVIFSFINQVFTGMMNASGDSHTPFVANSIGLIINLLLDPVLIFGVGFIPSLGVVGAGLATILAQMIVMLIFIYKIKKINNILNHLKLKAKYQMKYYLDIAKIGFPMGLQSMLFSICSMIVAGVVAGYGDGAVAAQKVGTQVESLSWSMAEGFEATINSFIAQNYGAKKYDRVNKGYRSIISIASIWGIFCSIVLIAFPGEIFSIFLSDPEVIPLGVSYMRIIGFSQLFMVVEITTAGAFSGLGNSIPPSFISIVFTFGRVPAILLMTKLVPGLDVIWWVISISSILKGTILVIWFVVYKNKKLRMGDNYA